MCLKGKIGDLYSSPARVCDTANRSEAHTGFSGVFTLDALPDTLLELGTRDESVQTCSPISVNHHRADLYISPHSLTHSPIHQ